MKTIIVWFRRDLRIHDHPALTQAIKDGDKIIPLFIIDPAFTDGVYASANRNQFLLDSLQDLKENLMSLGANLIVRVGTPEDELSKLLKEHNADAVYVSRDYVPMARSRDSEVEAFLEKQHVELTYFGGLLLADSVESIVTKTGGPYKVFTPFYKNWLQLDRRSVLAKPPRFELPADIRTGSIPKLDDIMKSPQVSPDIQRGGETAARQRLFDFIDEDIDDYIDIHDNVAEDRTSRLSAYLHFGCMSPRDAESHLSGSKGAEGWRRQLAWRDFYHYTLLTYPDNTKQAFQEKYRGLKWSESTKHFEAWKAGKTGYPIVDAAMRQLIQEGWMHNRARLIVGSFLTKDLWLDWRKGELYFMSMLIDGDVANNNGNWQWIASVGVDPAPVYRRLYNPSSQQTNYDPTNAYVRKYVPELSALPDECIVEPWKMSAEQQQKYGVEIGKDYPAPVVNHAEARQHALEQYRSA